MRSPSPSYPLSSTFPRIGVLPPPSWAPIYSKGQNMLSIRAVARFETSATASRTTKSTAGQPSLLTFWLRCDSVVVRKFLSGCSLRTGTLRVAWPCASGRQKLQVSGSRLGERIYAYCWASISFLASLRWSSLESRKSATPSTSD